MTDNPQTESESSNLQPESEQVNPATQYDSPWNDVLERYFQDFILFFFPDIHRNFDWNQRVEFLDRELVAIISDVGIATQFVSKLVKVYNISGKENWFLVHFNVQNQDEFNFPFQMYMYNCYFFDKYDIFVTSIAVLGDDNPNWRPSQFKKQLLGCSINFQFPSIKLLDYQQRLSELEASCNPFAIVVMAHILAQITTNDNQERKQQKLALVKRLYDLSLERDSVVILFRFIDWANPLPNDLAQEFWQEYSRFEESKSMLFVTSVERIGIEKGFRQGLLEAIELGLELKFGNEALSLMSEISQLNETEKLRTVKEAIKTVNTLEELRQVYKLIAR